MNVASCKQLWRYLVDWGKYLPISLQDQFSNFLQIQVEFFLWGDFLINIYLADIKGIYSTLKPMIPIFDAIGDKWN